MIVNIVSFEYWWFLGEKISSAISLTRAANNLPICSLWSGSRCKVTCLWQQQFTCFAHAIYSDTSIIFFHKPTCQSWLGSYHSVSVPSITCYKSRTALILQEIGQKIAGVLKKREPTWHLGFFIPNIISKE